MTLQQKVIEKHFIQAVAEFDSNPRLSLGGVFNYAGLLLVITRP
jgi:hypothetical protein